MFPGVAVKEELSLMSWANKFSTLGFTTATPQLPRGRAVRSLLAVKVLLLCRRLQDQISNTACTSSIRHLESQQGQRKISLNRTTGKTSHFGPGAITASECAVQVFEGTWEQQTVE